MSRKRKYLGCFILLLAFVSVILYVGHLVKKSRHADLLRIQQQQQRQLRQQEQQQRKGMHLQQQQQQQQQPKTMDVVLTKLAWPDETVMELEWDPQRFPQQKLANLRQSLDRLFGIDTACWKQSHTTRPDNRGQGRARLEMKLPPGFGNIDPIQKKIEKEGIRIVSTKQAVSSERQRLLLQEATQDFALQQLEQQKRALRVDPGIPQVELIPAARNKLVTLRARARALVH